MTDTTSLAPLLYIGIISATRRILAIGAASTLGEAVSETEFRDRMIDLGANRGVVWRLPWRCICLVGDECRPLENRVSRVLSNR